MTTVVESNILQDTNGAESEDELSTDRHRLYPCVVVCIFLSALIFQIILTVPNEQATTPIDILQGYYGSSWINYTAHSKNLCNLPNTLFLASHKTGGYFRTWMHVFKEECNVKKNILQFNGHQNWNDVTRFIRRFNDDYLILLSVRHPLEIILSGYNYHAKGAETAWTARSIEKAPLKHCFKDLWSNEFLITGDDTMYSEYEKGYANNYSNYTALQHGLYLEMLRYTQCEHVHISNVYHKFKANMQRYNIIFVRFQWFHQDNYADSIYYLLDAMHIHANVYLNQTKLAARLLEYDLSKLPPNNHSTRGKYNHTKQLQLLLTAGINDNVCLHIRNMSMQLDFPWKYNSIC